MSAHRLRSRLDCAAEVDDVAVLDDVFLAFEPLQVPGFGLFEGAGCLELVECGDLGADEALGEVGVDLAGGLDGVRRRVRGSSRAPRALRP